jgi:gas vesicle protein
MNTRSQTHANHNFLIGLMTGSAIGAGLAILFAPRLASELRQRVTDSATDLGNAASRRYQDVTTRIADVVDEVTTRGQAIRDDVADAVGLGAREVEQLAMASKTQHTANDRARRTSGGKHSAP